MSDNKIDLTKLSGIRVGPAGVALVVPSDATVPLIISKNDRPYRVFVASGFEVNGTYAGSAVAELWPYVVSPSDDFIAFMLLAGGTPSMPATQKAEVYRNLADKLDKATERMIAYANDLRQILKNLEVSND